MSFNAQEYLDSVGSPVYVDSRGYEHKGRVLSYDEWLPFQARMNAALRSSNGKPDYPTVRAIVGAVCSSMFPRKPWWKFWQHTVRRDVLSLPPIAMIRAFWSFQVAQGKALGIEMEVPPGLEKLLVTEAA